jgi:hypothetical protein
MLEEMLPETLQSKKPVLEKTRFFSDESALNQRFCNLKAFKAAPLRRLSATIHIFRAMFNRSSSEYAQRHVIHASAFKWHAGKGILDGSHNFHTRSLKRQSIGFWASIFSRFRYSQIPNGCKIRNTHSSCRHSNTIVFHDFFGFIYHLTSSLVAAIFYKSIIWANN